MVTSDGRVKLTDFGIAKATGSAQTGSFLTATGTTVGTPNYMAPEQAMGQEVGPWTDLYSVGVMAFEFFVGRVPFRDTEEPMAVLMRQVSDPIPAARSLNPEIDQSVSDWIERLLVKDPRRAHGLGRRGVGRVRGDRDLDGRTALAALGASARAVRAAAGHAGGSGHAASNAAPPDAPLDRRPGGCADASETRHWPRPSCRRRPRAGSRQTTGRSAARRRFAPAMKAGVLVVALLFALAAGLSGRGSDAGRSSDRRGDRPDLDRHEAPTCRSGYRAGGRGSSARPTSACRSHMRRRWRPAAAATARSWSSAVARGRRASNGALLPATFLDSIGQSTGTVPRRAARSGCLSRTCRRGATAAFAPSATRRQLTVYTVPTSRRGGDGGVRRYRPPPRPPSPRSATRSPGHSSSGAGRAYPIGPSDAYASSLNGTIGDLQQTTKSGEETLARLADAGRSGGGRTGAGQRLRECRQPARRARPEPSRQGGKRAARQGAPSRR